MRRLVPLVLTSALAFACSSSDNAASPSDPGPVAEGGAPSPVEDGGGVATVVDAASAAKTSTGGSGGLSCTRRDTVGGRAVCVATIGSIEVKVVEPASKSTGPLRLGLYLHGDGAAAHKSGSVFKSMTSWIDGQNGLAVSALAPNGCAWWQAPTHDCASSQVDADVAGANAAALVVVVEALRKAYDIRNDGVRYYGASGGSIFLTDEWLPLQAGTYPGVFALMCGGNATTRPFAWDTTSAALRGASPLWFTYGDQDFLLSDEKAAVAAFHDKAFAVTERVVPNAGHCAFDAHGEAVAIWNANP
jgi:hypothetical protein